MKAIIISPEEFLVNTNGEKDLGLQISNEIISIDRKETRSYSCYGGGSNDNVPIYAVLEQEAWDKASEKFMVIELESMPELLKMFNTVHNAHTDQFESESDFMESHGYAPLN